MNRIILAVLLSCVVCASGQAVGEDTRVQPRRTFVFVLAIDLPSSGPSVTVDSADQDRVRRAWEWSLWYPKGEHPSLVAYAGQYKADGQRALRWFARHCLLGEPTYGSATIFVPGYVTEAKEVPAREPR
jgi:hypothetical protein